MDIIYDGTIEGLLATFFVIYDEKIPDPIIKSEKRYVPSMFDEPKRITTNQQHADRVLKAMRKKTGRDFHRFFSALHNDRDGIENDIFSYVRTILSNPEGRSKDYSHPAVLKIAQYAKSVHREKHRMEAFVRFRLTHDGIYFASIEPDFDVLPLIKHHFRERYGDQQWIIYDIQRDYGLHYDLTSVQRVEMTFDIRKSDLLDTSLDIFTEGEVAFQELWANYFKSTNIPARKNMRLHLQHVPKRYWKYLSEKRIRI